MIVFGFFSYITEIEAAAAAAATAHLHLHEINILRNHIQVV